MKKHLLWLLMLTWSITAFSQSNSLRVCAQNLQNYYIHSNTGRGNYTESQMTAKTNKIVNMMLDIDADIYAFCEVEAKPDVLEHLAATANSYVTGDPYVAVTDYIDEDWDATHNNNIKSGFIYRSDRVQPVGSNYPATYVTYYCNTMRYQAFQLNSNGEKLVLSMNHFKAKDSSDDEGNAKRVTNATNLVNALSYVSTDPDILILGDLNCEYGEEPISYIIGAGYTEQLLRFNDANIYSHCYGGGELIDHVFANSTMAQQVTNAYVDHRSTTCSVGVTSQMSYSDHDPYVVEINLSSNTSETINTCKQARDAALSVSANNELYNNGAVYSIRGYVTRIQTAYNEQYGNITFWMADTENGGSILEAYRCNVSPDAVPEVGDYVEVTGSLTKYNSTPEFASGCTCQILAKSTPPTNLGEKTIAQFLSIKSAKDTCILTGVVSDISNTLYGNFYITDNTGSLYIYGLLTADGQSKQFESMNIEEGDTLRLKALYNEYNNAPQASNAIYVSHSKFVEPSSDGVPTVADLIAAGYNTTDNIVICHYYVDGPCFPVVIAGSYSSWTTDPDQLVHMNPLIGFPGWYAAQIPYTGDDYAKPVQLNNDGSFSWNNQTGDYDAWTHKGGKEAIFNISGIAGEVDIYYDSPGAYIYEVAYWKNHNNPCFDLVTTYTVYLSAPTQDAPETVEIIGSFDNWAGTTMSYVGNGLWTATITASPNSEFKFRQAGTWEKELLKYNAENNSWNALPNLFVRDYLNGDYIYVDFSNTDLYSWVVPQQDDSYLYIPYNLQAVVADGKVEFTWDVDIASDYYYLHVYDVTDGYLGRLTVYNERSITYWIEDFLDGREIQWSLQPVSPYELTEVFAPNTIVLHKSETEITNISLTSADSRTLDLTWQCNEENILFLIEIYYYNDVIRVDTVNTTEYHFTTNVPGIHYVYIRPLSADGEPLARYVDAGYISLENVPVPFSNLQGEANGHELTFTWDAAIDSVYVMLFQMVDGEFNSVIYQKPVGTHSLTYTVEEDGTYALQLYAYGEIRPGQYGVIYYGSYVTVQAFTVPTYLVQIDATEGGYVWPNGMSGNYPLGYVLNVYAYAYDGYNFVRWSDGNTDSNRSITVEGPMSITAIFEPITVGIDDVQNDKIESKKIIRNGQIFILRGDKIYTIDGRVAQ